MQVIKIVVRRGDALTDRLLRLQSHPPQLLQGTLAHLANCRRISDGLAGTELAHDVAVLVIRNLFFEDKH
jgi:hypothetical protein